MIIPSYSLGAKPPSSSTPVTSLLFNSIITYHKPHEITTHLIKASVHWLLVSCWCVAGVFLVLPGDPGPQLPPCCRSPRRLFKSPWQLTPKQSCLWWWTQPSPTLASYPCVYPGWREHDCAQHICFLEICSSQGNRWRTAAITASLAEV